MEKIKIGIFGGTFDPPHIGHINIAKKIIKLKKLNRILFIPRKNISYNEKKYIISPLNDRINMLKIATNKISNIKIYNLENKFNSKIIYTVDIMNFFKEQFPKHIFYFIMGTDNLSQIHKWHNYIELINTHKLIICNRIKTNNSYYYNKNILLKNININLTNKLFNSIIKCTNFNISSTMIRKSIKLNKNNKFINTIDRKMMNYIKIKKLYK